METVVVIERKTFEEIMARFNRLVNRVDEIRRKSEAKRLGEWLDSSEVSSSPSSRSAADGRP